MFALLSFGLFVSSGEHFVVLNCSIIEFGIEQNENSLEMKNIYIVAGGKFELHMEQLDKT